MTPPSAGALRSAAGTAASALAKAREYASVGIAADVTRAAVPAASV